MKEELFVAPVSCLHSEVAETITVFACSVQEALNEIALREPSADNFEI
jgi:hypothetical protein